MAVRRLVMGVTAFAVLALTIVGVLAGPASAHSGDESYAYLDVTERSLGGRIDVPVPELEEATGLQLDTGDIDELLANVAANRGAIDAYLDDHFDIGAEGASWPVTFQEAEPLFEDISTDLYVLFPFEAQVPGEVPRVFDMTFDVFVDENPNHRPIALIRNDPSAGVASEDGEQLAVFSANTRSLTIDLGDTGWWKNFRSSIDLGVDHIKTGPDHILFIMVLVLPAVVIWAAGAWRPEPTFGASLWRVLKIVTMFTIAHSITFTLAGLDYLPLPSAKITESIIALSIAAAALNNVRPVVVNREWIIAGAFGLFHGMGFASLVEGLDVDKSTQLVSLLGRNVGIEIGQALVVILLFPALYLLRRTVIYVPFMILASVALSVVSLGWGIERLFEVDLGIDAWVDPVVEWPRSFYAILVVTAIAGAIHLYERNNDRLLPVWTGEDDDPAGPAEDEREAALV